MFISIVIPVFQAEDNLDLLLGRLERSVKELNESFEIILVDDGSLDDSWSKISNHYFSSNNIKALKFSRNFGQHNAITAGLEISTGDWVVVMDCDLQDQPEEIIRLLKKAEENFDVVLGQRIYRNDSIMKIWTSYLFYRVLEKLTGLIFEKGIGNFGIYRRNVIDAVLSYKENFRPFPIIVKVVGFKRCAIEVKHAKRKEGKSSYTGIKLLKGALNTIIYYSNKPIWIFIAGGMGVITFIFFLLLSVFFLLYEIQIRDLILSLILLLSFVSLNVAIIGIYVSRIFIESKSRPLYIIDEKLL